MASCTKSSVYLFTSMRALPGKKKKKKEKVYNGKTMKINCSKFFFLFGIALLWLCLTLYYGRLAIYIDPISNLYYYEFNMDLIMSVTPCFI